MTFAEAIREYLDGAEEKELEEFLSGGFSFERAAAGYECAVRRSRDRLPEPADDAPDGTARAVETELFLFDKNGGKKKLNEGVLVTIRGEEAPGGRRTFLREVRPADRNEVYYAQAASRGGKLISEAGGSDFLGHDVMIGTPEKEWIPLDELDFSKHPLFMLGLYGGEYQIGVREKN